MESTQVAASTQRSRASLSLQRDAWSLTVVSHREAKHLGSRLALPVGSDLVLGRGSTLLGAGALDDHRISRRHVKLHVDPTDALWVTDLNSRNGVQINGLATQHSRLAAGDVLALGEAVFAFVLRAPAVYPAASHCSLRGSSARHCELVNAIAARAARAHPVLVYGECGSGRSSVCDALHAQSGRNGPRIELRCGTLPESELYEALHGRAKQPGLLGRADGGTLVVDGIEDASPTLQRVLTSFLDSARVEPLGEARARDVDVRVLLTARSSLSELMQAGRVQTQLGTRLQALELRVPPLRERPEDIPQLVHLALALRGEPDRRVHPQLMLRLLRHHFSANVTELFNVVNQLCDHTPHGATLRMHACLDPWLRAPEESGSYDEAALDVWRVGAHCEWVQPPRGQRIDLRTKPTLARVLNGLVETAERRPGSVVSVAELVQRGWPDERLLQRSAKNRVYVAISTLRKMGLAPALERHTEGYRFVPSVRVLRASLQDD